MKICLLALVFVFFVSCQARDESVNKLASLKQDTLRTVSDTSGPEIPRPMPNFAVAGLDKMEVRVFFDTLKQAFANDNKAKIAALISYPLRVYIDGQLQTIPAMDDFILHYPKIITDDVKGAVLNQQFTELFVNWQGVRIGRGELWFGGVVKEGAEAGKAYRLEIIAINNQ
jgi:hypothetical protein